jgi:hypothetical protein
MSILRLLRGGQWVRKGYADLPAQFDHTVLPGEDIQTAINNAAPNESILITNGTYRLTSALDPKAGQTIAGQTNTIISGSEILSNWTPDGSGHWYSTGHLPASYVDGGVCDDTTQNICQKREQVFIDGVHMTRVMNLGAVTANTFYEDYATNRVYIGQDPSGKLVEMSKTDYAIHSQNNGVRITGLTFQHFATPSQQGAIFTENGEDWEIDHNTVRWTHAIGIFVYNADRVRIHDNYVHHSGQLGIGHARTDDSFIEANEVSYNNTDGYWGGDWESGGIKVTNSHHATTRQNNVHDNNGLGIWYDINNWMSTITDNDINDNFADGIRYEISYQAEISYNRVRGNGYGFAENGRNGQNIDGSLFATGGININGSSDVEIHNNTLGPNQNGITAQERTRTNSDTDISIGPWDTHNLWVHHNDITQTTGSTFGYGIAAGLNTLSPTDLEDYYLPAKNNRFDFNTYHLDSAAAVRFSWNHGYRNFTTWQTSTTDPGSGPVFTGQEAGGTCGVALLPGWQVVASGDDGGWSNNSTPTTFSRTGTTVRLGDFSSVDLDRNGWVRFTGLGIPKNATINSAILMLYATGVSGTIPALVIDGEAADNATAPTTRADVNARSRTTAQVNWTPASWTINSWRASPDIAAVVQEIVDRTNWNAGNAMQLFVNDGQAGQVAGQISFQAYDGNPVLSANLQVTWS